MSQTRLPPDAAESAADFLAVDSCSKCKRRAWDVGCPLWRCIACSDFAVCAPCAANTNGDAPAPYPGHVLVGLFRSGAAIEKAANMTSYLVEVHQDMATCSFCRKVFSGIPELPGPRWRCASCPDFLLCQNCIGIHAASEGHNQQHVLLRETGSPRIASFDSIKLHARVTPSPNPEVYCNLCSCAITTAARWACQLCPDFDCCEACVRRALGAHKNHPFVLVGYFVRIGQDLPLEAPSGPPPPPAAPDLPPTHACVADDPTPPTAQPCDGRPQALPETVAQDFESAPADAHDLAGAIAGLVNAGDQHRVLASCAASTLVARTFKSHMPRILLDDNDDSRPADLMGLLQYAKAAFKFSPSGDAMKTYRQAARRAAKNRKHDDDDDDDDLIDEISSLRDEIISDTLDALSADHSPMAGAVLIADAAVRALLVPLPSRLLDCIVTAPNSAVERGELQRRCRLAALTASAPLQSAEYPPWTYAGESSTLDSYLCQFTLWALLKDHGWLARRRSSHGSPSRRAFTSSVSHSLRSANAGMGNLRTVTTTLCGAAVAVVPFPDLISAARRKDPIPAYQECAHADDSVPDDAIFIFASHRWLSANHPCPDGSDWLALCDMLTSVVDACVTAAIVVLHAVPDVSIQDLCERLDDLDQLSLPTQGETSCAAAGNLYGIILTAVLHQLRLLSAQERAQRIKAGGSDEGWTAIAESVLSRVYVWYDYTCLPQRVGRSGPFERTHDEIALLRHTLRALGDIQEQMCTVVVNTAEGKDYVKRAWCVCEFLNSKHPSLVADQPLDPISTQDFKRAPSFSHTTQALINHVMLDALTLSPQHALELLGLRITRMADDSVPVCSTLWRTVRAQLAAYHSSYGRAFAVAAPLRFYPTSPFAAHHRRMARLHLAVGPGGDYDASVARLSRRIDWLVRPHSVSFEDWSGACHEWRQQVIRHLDEAADGVPQSEEALFRAVDLTSPEYFTLFFSPCREAGVADERVDRERNFHRLQAVLSSGILRGQLHTIAQATSKYPTVILTQLLLRDVFSATLLPNTVIIGYASTRQPELYASAAALVLGSCDEWWTSADVPDTPPYVLRDADAPHRDHAQYVQEAVRAECDRLLAL